MRFDRNYLTYSARTAAAQKATRGCASLFGSIFVMSVFGFAIPNDGQCSVKLHEL